MFILVSNMSSLAIKFAKYLNDKKLLSGIIIQNINSNKNFYSFRSFLSHLHYGLKNRSEFPWEIIQRKKTLNQLLTQVTCPILQVNDINESKNVEKFLFSTQANCAIIIGGKIIKTEVLGCFKGEWVNIHGGILPQYRGLDSEYWAILNQDYENIGVTVHKVVEKVDYGDILLQKTIAVTDFDENLSSVISRNRENAYLVAVDFVKNWIDRKIYLEDSNKFHTLNKKSTYYSSPKKAINFRKPIRFFTKND
jgi:methionyl-tRNA formyltransferase